LFATPSTYIWALASDASGVIYAATGAPARIYRITPDGTASIIFEAKELQVQSIIADKSGTLYAATNPDGKIFKLEHKPGAAKTAESKAKTEATLPTDPNWTATVFFDPATRYLWDLALDGSGNLFVATGDGGQILKVTPGGEHSVFFKSDENHIRKLAFDRKGNLIAGSDGSGLVYRITPSGEAFVLYSAAKREITALAVDDQGNIYAAGVGEKRGVTPQFGGFGNPSPVATPTFGTSAGGPGTVTMGGSASPMPSGPFPFPPSARPAVLKSTALRPMALRSRFGPRAKTSFTPSPSTRKDACLPERAIAAMSSPSIRVPAAPIATCKKLRPRKSLHSLRLRTAASMPLPATSGNCSRWAPRPQATENTKATFSMRISSRTGDGRKSAALATSNFGCVPVTSTTPTAIGAPGRS